MLSLPIVQPGREWLARTCLPPDPMVIGETRNLCVRSHFRVRDEQIHSQALEQEFRTHHRKVLGAGVQRAHGRWACSVIDSGECMKHSDQSTSGTCLTGLSEHCLLQLKS